MILQQAPPFLTATEREELRHAKELLENPGFPARIANILGTPLERGFSMMPRDLAGAVHRATRTALFRALDVAVSTINAPSSRAAELLNKILVGASGGVAGAFGLPALIVELPVSTTLMLRSIAQIAMSEGHDLETIKTRLRCLEVFALGGKSPKDDAVESGYWAVRAALGSAISEAAAYITHRGFLDRSAPVVLRLISAVAGRFGVLVTEQVAAKAIPVLGAAGGSVINVLFMAHFQDMARGHFIVMRLEEKYGADKIQSMYASMPT